jgi:hypothetical protein
MAAPRRSVLDNEPGARASDESSSDLDGLLTSATLRSRFEDVNVE